MYMVVSRWRVKPGQEQEFERIGKETAGMLRSQPGVRFLEVIRFGDIYLSVHAYDDEATYRALVQDENGPFNRAMAQYNMEAIADWIGSERGETIA